MKIQLTFISLIALSIASCTGTRTDSVNDSISKVNKAADSAATDTKPANTDYCFIMIQGSKALDTTKVNLHIDGDKVTGDMAWLPAEKDRRKGTLSGTIKGDKITAVWSYMQEGGTDTLGVAFQLKDGQLAQKPFKYDGKTGREHTDNTAAYTAIYQSCK